MTNSAHVIFENGDFFTTDINGTDEEVAEYYAVGKFFNLGTCGDNMQAVRECIVNPKMKVYRASFRGRTKNAIGIFYPIETTVKGFSEVDARQNLYSDFEHIQSLKLTIKEGK